MSKNNTPLDMMIKMRSMAMERGCVAYDIANIYEPKPIMLNFVSGPRAVQSVRFARVGNKIHKYQPKEVQSWKRAIVLQAQAQLAKISGFKRFEGPLLVEVDYRYAPLKSMKAAEKELIASGNGYILKDTKPDLTDNLNKGLMDSLTGLVWRDDAVITAVAPIKRYAQVPGITMWIYPLVRVYFN